MQLEIFFLVFLCELGETQLMTDNNMPEQILRNHEHSSFFSFDDFISSRGSTSFAMKLSRNKQLSITNQCPTFKVKMQFFVANFHLIEYFFI